MVQAKSIDDLKIPYAKECHTRNVKHFSYFIEGLQEGRKHSGKQGKKY